MKKIINFSSKFLEILPERFAPIPMHKSLSDLITLDICSDNIFIFHLTEKCFWHLAEVIVRSCTALKFVPHQNSNNLLIGNKSGFIYEIEISEYNILNTVESMK